MDKSTLRAEIDQLLDTFSEEALIKTKEYMESTIDTKEKIDIDKYFDKIIEEDGELLKRLAQ